MSKLVHLFLIIIFIFTSSGLWAESDYSSKDVAQIKSLVQGLMTSWNQNDMDRLASYWTADGDIVTIPGTPPAKGKPAVIAQIKKDKENSFKDSRMAVEITNMKFYGDKVAMVEIREVLTGLKTLAGRDLGTVVNHFILLMEKNKGQWKIGSLRRYSSAQIIPVE